MSNSALPFQSLVLSIKEASDSENWERVSSLVDQLDAEVRKFQFSPANKAALSHTIARLNEASANVDRRKEEIRNLVNNIGSSPL